MPCVILSWLLSAFESTLNCCMACHIMPIIGQLLTVEKYLQCRLLTEGFSVVNSGNLSEKTATDWSDVDTPVNVTSARGSDSDDGDSHRVTALCDSVSVGQTSNAVECQLKDAAEALQDAAATGYEQSSNTLSTDDCVALESQIQVCNVSAGAARIIKLCPRGTQAQHSVPTFV